MDKQINSRELEVSNYWIRDFLAADFRTTSAAGTRRLAVAMRDAARKSPDPSVRREIAAAATLGVGLDGQSVTIEDFGARMGLSDQAREAITKQLSNAHTVNDRFQFDREEFIRQLPYRSMELDTGAILTAASPNFDELFEREHEPDGRTRFSTVGEIVSEKLEKLR